MSRLSNGLEDMTIADQVNEIVYIIKMRPMPSLTIKPQ